MHISFLMDLSIRNSHFTTIPDDALQDLTVVMEFSLTDGLLNHVPDVRRCVALTFLKFRRQNISFVPRLVRRACNMWNISFTMVLLRVMFNREKPTSACIHLYTLFNTVLK